MTALDLQVKELAEQLSKAFVRDKRNNGESFVHLRDGSPDWMTAAIRATHGDRMPDDVIYEFCEEAADAIAETDDNEDAQDDAIREMEADTYTAELTGWLHSNVHNVYYLTQAIEDFGPPEDGFKLLAMALTLHKQEVGYALLQALREQAKAESRRLTRKGGARG